MSHIPTRQLGRNGPQVTALGFGALGLSTFYGKPQPDEERFAFLDHAHKVGARNWDTADVYGDNEDLIGEWFRRSGKRDDVSRPSSHSTYRHTFTGTAARLQTTDACRFVDLPSYQIRDSLASGRD